MKRAKTQQLYHKKKYLWKGQSESTYRHNNWLVLIEERLITGGGVNNCESLMSQVAITVLVQSTPVWATMLQSMKGQNKTKIISNWNSTFVQPKKLLIIFYHKFFFVFFWPNIFFTRSYYVYVNHCTLSWTRIPHGLSLWDAYLI